MTTTADHETTSARPSLYICPRTREPLVPRGSTLIGPDGEPRYEIIDGIPRFLEYEGTESEEVERQLRTVTELARHTDWRRAIEEVYGKWEYVDPTRRSRWLEILPLDRSSVVLEIGPGMGQFTPLLSERCDRLCALEVVPGQAAFVAERCRQSGCNNVEVACGGDDCRLPYQHETFDLVVMNLVFEWCATREGPAADLVDGQRQMLHEAARVLKRGGSLYLLTKNRYALRLLLGKRDEHAYEIRWGNALPRRLMRLALRARGHSRPRGVLHSYRSLLRMLHDAGFGRIRSYWAVPEMRYPTHCIPTDAASVRAARRKPDFVQGEFRSTRLLMRFVPASLVKHVAPALQFVAEKGETPPPSA